MQLIKCWVNRKCKTLWLGFSIFLCYETLIQFIILWRPSTIKLFHCCFITTLLLLLWIRMQISELQNIWHATLQRDCDTKAKNYRSRTKRSCWLYWRKCSSWRWLQLSNLRKLKGWKKQMNLILPSVWKHWMLQNGGEGKNRL